MNRKWWTLFAVCLATFMLLLDVTIVNVALPYIERDLGSTFTDLQWVIDAYALTLAALLLTGGSLGDRVGRRAVFAVGIVIFTLASMLCGLAASPLMLNVARGLQGIGAAFMFATSLALLGSAFHGPARGTAFGLWGATTGAAVAIGPLVGGSLVVSVGWEAIFYINVPIGIFTLALTLAKVDESRGPTEGRPDWLGTVLFSAALFALIFGLIRGNPEGWSSPLISGLLAASAMLLVAFLIMERRVAHPMLDLSLFRKPAFVGASIVAFVLSGSIFAMFLYLTLYIQNILGYSALEAGWRFMPVTAMSFLVAPVAGALADRLGVRWFMLAGLAAVGLGLLLMAGLEPGDDWTILLPGFLVAGLGIGLANPPLASAAIGVVDPRRSGMASGINSTFRQVGLATGIAAWGALFEHRVTSVFREGAATAHLDPTRFKGNVAEFVSFGVARRTGNPTLIRIAEEAFVSGLRLILVVAAVMALVGAVLAGVLVRPRDFVAHADNATDIESDPVQNPFGVRA